MINSKKKGFTIVELVIVIAVIAILSAVLIPTFSNLVKKANTSADIQAVRQMNVQLAIDEVEESTTINNIFDVLTEAGMTAKDYTPLSSDTYFFWDKTLNRVLYTDKNNNVIYPEEYKTATKANGWYSLSGKIDESSATIQLSTDDVTSGTSLTYDISNAADMSKLVNYVNKNIDKYKNISSLTLNITDNIDLMGADIVFENLSAVNIIINGNNNVLYGLYASEKHFNEGKNSDGNTDKYGSALFVYVKSLEVNNLTIKDSVTGNVDLKQGALFAAQIVGTAKFSNVTVENCVVSGLNKTGILAGYTHGAITLSNVTLKDNTVISKEGESGVLFGVAEYGTGNTYNNAGHFTVSGLTMKNNVIKFDENTKTFTATIDNVDDNKLPLNKEFAYKTGETTEGRIGLASVCFVFTKAFSQKNNITINNVVVNFAEAIHTIEGLTSN